MQGCAMRLGDRRVWGICLCGFHGYAPSRGFMVSFTPYAITYMGSLRIVEFQVLWITDDHGSVLECWRFGFVSSICFLGVRLVSGVLIG